jgi:superfamily II DNA/RNA helicase
MYNARSQRASRGRGKKTFSRPAGNFGNRFSNGPRNARKITKLNHDLFVKKAVDTIQTPEVIHEIRHVFNDFAFCNELKVNIGNKGFTTPTPIQDQAIPIILEGRDVIGIANTGTGKTAAFLVPTIDKLYKKRGEKVLIVAPTRELALQINEEFREFSKGMRLFSVLTIGGASMNRQIQELRRGHDFVIGTPGRLKDLIQHKALNLSQFHTVVLDEVDRMVDIGFIKDIQYLISLMPRERHSLFFSATITDKVDEILKQFVSNPVTVSVKTTQTAETIDQDIVKVPNGSNKVDVLHDLLIQDDFDKVMVFGRTKWGIEKLTRQLVERGFKAMAIHGNKSQGQRQRALASFKRNEVNILLATDVASRGIDVEDVTHVINYDAPESYDDYVHRIGRTGRANKKGKALTFVE